MKEIILALAESTKIGLTLVNTKESRKYVDEIIEIEKELNNEYLRPETTRDDFVILKLSKRLLVYTSVLTSYGSTATTPTK